MMHQRNVGFRFKISVVVMAFDRTKYIRDAIKSVLLQTLNREFFEVVVIKNFSDLDIDNYIDSAGYISILSSDRGIGAKIVQACDVCKGDYIAILEDDDIFHPKKLEIIHNFLNAYPEINYLHNELIKFSCEKDLFDIDRYEQTPNSSRGPQVIKPITPNDINNLYNSRSYFNLSSIVFKKDIILKYRSLILECRLNVDVALFYLNIMLGSTFCITEIPLTYYRVHSSASNSEDLPYLQFIYNKQNFYLNFRDTFIKLQKENHNVTLQPFLRCELAQQSLLLLILSNSVKLNKSILREGKKCLICTKFHRIKLNFALFLLSVFAFFEPGQAIFMLYILAKFF